MNLLRGQKTRQLTIILLIIGICFCWSCDDSNDISAPPNIVFLLVDDLGWSDLGCYGSSFHETPNIDQLANEGIRFTNAYASCPVCSPTRASILTGKSPVSTQITDWIPGSDPKDRPLLGTEDRSELALEEITLAEMLKSKGYKTSFYGKWHLGGKGFYPEDQGFDINKGGHHAGQPASYFYPYKNKRKSWDVPGLEGGEEGEYLTDRLTAESLAFMEENKQDPFFLYISYYNVHTPIQAKPDLKTKYEEKKAITKWKDEPAIRKDKFEAHSKLIQDNPSYAGMVQSVDESVGNIMSRLEELGLEDNTLIIFTSDNGGLSTLPANRNAPTSVEPLRAGKGWLYEGGIRVPAIMKWPGKIKKGSESHVPIISTDFFPTIANIVDAPVSQEQELEGQDLMPLIADKVPDAREALYWHYPHYHGSNHRPSAAIRMGDYKLIEWFEDGDVELYNLKKDIGESTNIAESNREIASELQGHLKKWLIDNEAVIPKKNPDYVR